jgi:hypothetical protein
MIRPRFTWLVLAPSLLVVLTPTRAPASPIVPSELVGGARTVVTRTPVLALSGDGARAAFVVSRTAADCDHVVVWTPATRALDRFRPPGRCKPGGHDTGPTIYDVELAGSRAAWASYFGCGNFCDFTLTFATLARRSPLELATTSSNSSGADVEFDLHGSGDLVVFNDESRLVRIGTGRDRCWAEGGDLLRPNVGARHCRSLRADVHACCVDDVAGGLIAVREADAVAVLDGSGKLVRLFPFADGEVTAARLDGGRLVVARGGVIETYDVKTGAPQLQLQRPAGFGLVAAAGGITLLQHGRTLELLRLADGRSLRLEPGRAPVLADLTLSGLFYSFEVAGGRGRVVFARRSGLLRRLGS